MAKCPECSGDGIIFNLNGTHRICNECGGSGKIPDQSNDVYLLEVMREVNQLQSSSMNEKAIAKLKDLHGRILRGHLIKNGFGDVVAVREPSETDLYLAEVIAILIDLLEAQHDKG